MMSIKVKYFLDCERRDEAVSMEKGSTIRDLIGLLGLRDENYYFYIVNGANKNLKYVLQPDDEIRLFPAMSGG